MSRHDDDATVRIASIAARLRSLAALSRDSNSFLYQRLTTTLADFLCEHPTDEISEWLGSMVNIRSDLEVSLLLLSAIHREILLHSQGTEKLHDYYPSAGGVKPPTDDDLPNIFLDTVREKMHSISDFMRNANVQTNETGRGVFWLIPAAFTGWADIHLVELGASAGLNLVAEQRKYSFIDEGESEFDIGTADSPQFFIKSKSKIPKVLHDSPVVIPNILSRCGCDMFPFNLETELDRTTLTSYVFADQVQRIERLKEGIEAFKKTQSETPIVISKAVLPDDLSSFLQSITSPTESAPVVIYNTCITGYLRDQGRELRSQIEGWAHTRQKPVLWVQLELVSDDFENQDVHNCAWTVDYWDENHQHRTWQLGWVHPHGFSLVWTEQGLNSFIKHFH